MQVTSVVPDICSQSFFICAVGEKTLCKFISNIKYLILLRSGGPLFRRRITRIIPTNDTIAAQAMATRTIVGTSFPLSFSFPLALTVMVGFEDLYVFVVSVALPDIVELLDIIALLDIVELLDVLTGGVECTTSKQIQYT